MARLIMMRHGQSLWNKKNRFTGWVDIPLSQEGVEEAIRAGQAIAEIEFDVIFVSALSRARTTMVLAMAQNHSNRVPVILHTGEGKLEEWAKIYSDEAASETIPVIQAWQLNERMYGELQGANKDEMREKFGDEQVHIWRRSYDVAPPEGESLKMTAERSIPYFWEKVVPLLADGKNVLISAHGNSLRSIVMDLDGLSEEEVVRLEIATGEPLLYRYEDGEFEKDLSR